jgi:hypothetical protein
MSRRFAFAVLALPLAPTVAVGQTRIAPAAFALSSSTPVGVHRLEPLCDGTEIRRVEIQQDIGKGMLFAGVAVGLLGAIAAHAHPERGLPVVLTAGALGLGGVIVAGTAYPSETFWQVTLARAQVGLTTPDDVRSCLHAPSGTSVAGSEEDLTYRARPSGVFRWGHWESSVRFTFNNGVLKEVRRTEGEVDDGRMADLHQP